MAGWWLVEAKVVQLHAQVVRASSAEEASRIANENGWNEATYNDTDSIEPYGEPLLRDDEDEHEHEDEE